jgi:hypothetical protein
VSKNKYTVSENKNLCISEPILDSYEYIPTAQVKNALHDFTLIKRLALSVYRVFLN